MSDLNFRKLFVHNLDYNEPITELNIEFEKFGKIVKFDVPRDHKDPSKMKG
jgi:hypothetical protein